GTGGAAAGVFRRGRVAVRGAARGRRSGRGRGAADRRPGRRHGREERQRRRRGLRDRGRRQEKVTSTYGRNGDVGTYAGLVEVRAPGGGWVRVRVGVRHDDQ